MTAQPSRKKCLWRTRRKSSFEWRTCSRQSSHALHGTIRGRKLRGGVHVNTSLRLHIIRIGHVSPTCTFVYKYITVASEASVLDVCCDRNESAAWTYSHSVRATSPKRSNDSSAIHPTACAELPERSTAYHGSADAKDSISSTAYAEFPTIRLMFALIL